jgi:hypothetical protein
MTYGGYVWPVVLAGRRRRQRLGCVNETLCTVKPTSTVHGLPRSTISHLNNDSRPLDSPSPEVVFYNRTASPGFDDERVHLQVPLGAL